MVVIGPVTVEIFLIWTNVARTNVAGTNVAWTNVAWINVTVTVGYLFKLVKKPAFRVWSKLSR